MALGLLVLRSSGPYFLMITLAFGQMLYALAWRWRSLTGGDDGLAGIPRPEIWLPVSMSDYHNFYYLVLIFFGLSFYALSKFIRSPLGRSIIGVRESESRMQALGYNTWALKYLAYIVAAAFAGLAGVLFVYFNGFISPEDLSWSLSGMIMLMVIIGGAGTLIGPVIGAGVIFILQNFISAYTERWPLFIGIIFVICVMYARNGIAGYLLKLEVKRRRCNESPGSKEHL
jgi:branched-chain amino acid transport system permease protein